MKRFLLAWMLLLPLFGWAQYAGGPGGSYASASLMVESQHPFSVQISPNPALAGEQLHLQVTDVRHTLKWEIHAMDGRVVGNGQAWPETDFYQADVQLPPSAAIYLVKVVVDGRIWWGKIVRLQP